MSILKGEVFRLRQSPRWLCLFVWIVSRYLGEETSEISFEVVVDDSNVFYQRGDVRAYTGTINFIPEPSTALLVAAGLAGLAAARRRRA